MAVMMYMKEGRNVERSTGSYMVFIMTVVVGTAVSYACGEDYRQLASKRLFQRPRIVESKCQNPI
ncbi:DUF1686 domain-containing protein [Encephalitozoon intestinalis]